VIKPRRHQSGSNRNSHRTNEHRTIHRWADLSKRTYVLETRLGYCLCIGTHVETGVKCSTKDLVAVWKLDHCTAWSLNPNVPETDVTLLTSIAWTTSRNWQGGNHGSSAISCRRDKSGVSLWSTEPAWQSEIRCQMNLEILTASIVLNGFWKSSLAATSVTSALEVILNEMRYINLRFTYLLT